MVTGGGWGRLSTVQVYTLSGPQEQLPSLLTSRYRHACAYYLDSQDRAVSIACDITSHLIKITIMLITLINIPSGQSSAKLPVILSPSDPVTWSTGHSVTRSLGHSVTWSLGHPVTRSPGHPVTWSPGHSVTRSLGHPVTRSLGHSVTRSPGHSVTRSLGH